MSRIQCKGCDYQPSSYDTIEGYCMGCAAQIIKAHEALLDENVRLKREHSIVLEDNQRIRENSKPENACRYCGASRITRTSGKWQFYCHCDDPTKRPKKPEPEYVDLPIRHESVWLGVWTTQGTVGVLPYSFTHLHCLPSLPGFRGFYQLYLRQPFESQLDIEEVAERISKSKNVIARLAK